MPCGRSAGRAGGRGAGNGRRPRDRGHAGQGSDAGAAGEAEQDRLGLVVAGVAEQDGGGAVALGGGVQGGVAGVPGGGFRTAVAADGDGDRLDGVQTEFAQPGGDLGGAQVGARLEAVVDGHAAGGAGRPGGFEGEGGGERHGVGAAGAGHEDERGGGPLVGRGPAGRSAVFGEDVVEDAADRQAYRRDRRMGTHVRFPSMLFRGLSPKVRSRRVCRW